MKRMPVDYAALREAIKDAHEHPGDCFAEGLERLAGSAIEDVLRDRDELVASLEQAQATIKEMGELIDDQNVELGNMATHTHPQKGGLYRFLGEGKVAGQLKMAGGPAELDVYMDTVSGQIYVRFPGEFASVMVAE